MDVYYHGTLYLNWEAALEHHEAYQRIQIAIVEHVKIFINSIPLKACSMPIIHFLSALLIFLSSSC